MIKKLGFTAFAILGLVLAAGCGQNQQANPVSDGQFQEKVRVFEADMLARLQDMETRLDMLQGHGLNLSEAAKDQWIEWSGKFSEAQESIKSKLETARNQTSATWGAFQTELDQHWAALEAAFSELKKITGKKE
jgi:hypothetical protein